MNSIVKNYLKKYQNSIFYFLFFALVFSFFLRQSSLNRINTYEESLSQTWTRIEGQLQRRYTLLSQLLEKSTVTATEKEAIRQELSRYKKRLRTATTRQARIEVLKDIEALILGHSGLFQRFSKQLTHSLERISVDIRVYNATRQAFLFLSEKRPYSWFVKDRVLLNYPDFTGFSLDDQAVLLGFSGIKNITKDKTGSKTKNKDGE